MERTFIDALLYAMGSENPSKAIENQEKREQQAVVRNSRLPKKSNEHRVPTDILRKGVSSSMTFVEQYKIELKNNHEFTKQQYEKMGIKVLDEYDDLFYSVELPEGWEIKPTGHPMWNDVLDDKNRKRISFFYKGAFYDRDAHSNFIQRYSYTTCPFDNYETDATFDERRIKPWKVYITDCEEKIEFLKEISPTKDLDHWRVNTILSDYAKECLNHKYPEWNDINAYWD